MRDRHPLLTEDVCREVHEQFVAKQKVGPELEAEIARIRERWPQIQTTIKESCPTSVSVESTLRAAGCVLKPSVLGVSKERLLRVMTVCREIRNRYVALDLMADLGVLEAWASDVASIVEGVDG